MKQYKSFYYYFITTQKKKQLTILLENENKNISINNWNKYNHHYKQFRSIAIYKNTLTITKNNIKINILLL